MPKKVQQNNITQLRKEREKLLVSQDNPKRLEEITKIIQFFDYGIE